MNVYKKELRFMKSTMLLWVVALGLVMVMFTALYPAFSNDVETSKRLLEQFPPQIRHMLGLSLSVFFTYLGFYAYIFSYITLAGGVMAMNMGLVMLAREQQAKTTDFLLTKPVTRTKLFGAKLAAVVSALVGVWSVYVLMAYGAAKLFGAGTIDGEKYLVLNGVFLLLLIWFMALGMLVSQLLHKIKSVPALSLSFVFGLFVVGLISALIGEEKMRFLSPFKYVVYTDYVANGTIDVPYVWLAVASSVAMIVAAYVVYVRRDVKAVV